MKGICFTEPLFHATIEGRKTMTRRLMEPQPDYVNERNEPLLTCATFPYACQPTLIKPRYKVGDIVYLKEPYYYDAATHRRLKEGKVADYVYYKYEPSDKATFERFGSAYKWKNKLFMPESAARYFIKITAVRAERLQEISDRDCFREGIGESESNFNGIPYFYGIKINGKFDDDLRRETPREAFAALIDKINGRGTWDSNPWVFVYEYEPYNKE